MIDNVFELENLERSGVLDVTVNGVSVLTSGNVAEVPAIPNYDSTRKVLSLDSTDDLSTLGPSSITEGNHCASYGAGSHSEGYNSVAQGQYSHVEGFCNTTNHFCQHVFGQFNSPDPASGSASTKGQYIEIVGNGEGVDDRANARTLDWDGNEVLAGKLTVGIQPTNNNDVATKQYVDDYILSGTSEPTSSVGRENSLYVKYNDGDEVIIPTIDNIYFKTNNTWIKDTFKDVIYVKTQTISIGQVQGNNYKTGTTPVSVEDGYTPIGIIGTKTTESLIVGYIDIELDDTLYKIYYKIFNPYSSASSNYTTLDVKVLYKKS